RVVGNPMEPRACLAHWDAASEQYHLYTCTQGAGIMRNQLSAVLGVPPEKIRVIAEEVGGGFGVRFNVYPEYCAALFAAKKAGRPIMSYALERLIEHAARELGIDAAEFRRRNFIRKFPYRIAAGFEYDSGDFEGAMNKALAAADWSGFGKRRAESEKRGRLRG